MSSCSTLLPTTATRSYSRHCANSVASELGREFDSWGFWLIKLLLARSTELGSRTLVHAGAQGADTHGQYLSDCEIADPAPVVVEDKETQDRVWNELVEKLEAIEPGVTRNF